MKKITLLVAFLLVICNMSVSAYTVDMPHDKYDVRARSDGQMYVDIFQWLESNNSFCGNRFIVLDNEKKYHTVDIFSTGKNYVMTETIAGDEKIYQSGDRINWEYVNTFKRSSGTIIFPGVDRDAYNNIEAQVINTGKEYLCRTSTYDNTSNMHSIAHPVMVFDLNFNYVKTIDLSDYVVDMSYVNNKYYLTTSDHNNIGKCTTYASSDLENWEEVGKNIGSPVSNGLTTLYKTRIDLRNEDRFSSIDTYWYEAPITESYMLPSKNIMEEVIMLFGLECYGEFFVVFDNVDNSESKYTDAENILGLDGNVMNIYKDDRYHSTPTFSFSKDGIYWATQELPEKDAVDRIVQGKDCILVYTFGGGPIYKYNFSDMEKAWEKISSQENTYVELNGRILGFSQPPVMEDDRTLVPMRFLFEQMGAEVDWNNDTQTATATVSADTSARTFGLESEKSVTFSIDNTTATVNGEAETMDVPARLINDQTFVPLRFLSENLGYNVEWDNDTRTAIITTE